jgi:hypothetical protein
VAAEPDAVTWAGRARRALVAATSVGMLAAGPGPAAAPAPVGDLADGRAGVIRFESVTPTGYFQLARREALAFLRKTLGP